MKEDKFGNYTASDAKGFTNKQEAFYHEGRLYEEDKRREAEYSADFKRASGDNVGRKHSFTFTDIVLFAPVLVLLVALCVSFSFKLLGVFIAWFLFAAVVKHYVDKNPARTRKVCFWLSVAAAGVGFVIYKSLTAH